jgi:hypothetical protein
VLELARKMPMSMVQTITRLREIADDFERRGRNAAPANQSELIDIAIKMRFLISEIARLFDLAKRIEETQAGSVGCRAQSEVISWPAKPTA